MKSFSTANMVLAGASLTCCRYCTSHLHAARLASVAISRPDRPMPQPMKCHDAPVSLLRRRDFQHRLQIRRVGGTNEEMVRQERVGRKIR